MSVEIHSKGTLRLDLSRYELSRSGQAVKLERQPMELLIFLVQRKGQLVPRNEIVEKLWGKDVYVDVDRSINAAVRKIRAALKDDPAAPTFLETIVGKGYRFVGNVEMIPMPVRQQEAAVPQASRPVGFRALLSVAIAILAALVMLAVLYSLNPGRWRARFTSASVQSLAVLPLENLSHDPEQDYFADGITVELITALSKINALRVISRTSVMRFRGSRQPLPEIARELGVDAVVEGSVRHSGNRVRITTQLIRARPEKQLWAKTYDRDIRDVLVLQADVAGAIAKQISAKINPVKPPKLLNAQQVDPEAYQLYLQGLYYLEKGGEASSKRSLEYFHKATERDSGFARGWAGLARGYNHAGDYARAIEAARKAIDLDETLSDGHATLAYATWNNDFDWILAEQEFKRAIELDPSSATPHHGYGVYLAALGRHDEARVEMRRAVELDPLAPLANANLGSIYWSSHDFDRAIQQLERTLEIDSKFADAHLYLGMVYESQGRYELALSEFEKCRTLANHSEAEAELARIYAVRGRRAETLRLLEDLKAGHEHGERSSYDIALVYVALDDRDHAFSWLQSAYSDSPSDLLQLSDDLRFDSLRSDARFRDLLRRVNYPD